MLSKRIINRELTVAPFNRRNTNWIAAAASAAAAIGASVWGGIQARKAQKKAAKEQARRERSERAWYTRRYNQDYLDTAAGQNLVRQANAFADKQWRKAEGAKAVGGGTDAATAQAKESTNNMMGNTIANIAANDTARKDAVDSQHQQNLNNFSQQVQTRYEQQAGDVTNASQNASNAMISMGGALESGKASSSKINPALQGGTATQNADGTTKYYTAKGTEVNGSVKYNGSPTKTDLTGKVADSLGGADPNDVNVQKRLWHQFYAI